jgi:DNA/RNA-binding domain of Phe-tRNA-synthetase-like protein
VAPDLRSEFPGLGIAWIEVGVRPGKSPEPVRRRLEELANRVYGSEAIRLRERPIPWAYRVFFRHIGLDPDKTRTPVEQLTLDRLREGGFRSRGLPEDALTLAIVETGIALCAFDADRIEGELCIRDTAPGESLAGRPGEVAKGTLAIADENGLAALLFGAIAEDRAVDGDSSRAALAAIQVGGVPQIAVEEALWLAATALEAP